MENNNTQKTTKKDEKISALEQEVADLKQMIADLLAAKKEVAPAVQPSVNIVTPNTDVVLVYCSDSMGHLATAHVDLTFNHWGESFTLSRSQFDEVVGKYRHWFDDGILAVSGDTEDGMKVYRNNDIVLTANNQGVDAKNLHATTYLIIGGNSRMESVTENGDKRTAVFWIGS